MKKKFLKYGIMAVASTMLFTGCTQKTKIPAGYDGKILTSNGYAPEIFQPGAVKVCGLLDFNCYNQLVVLETAKKAFKDSVTIRMKDNLNLKVDYVRIVVQPRKDKKTLNQLFNDIKPKNISNNEAMITLDEIYKIYGKTKVTRIIREVLSKYTIDEARLNYSRISAQVFNRIQREFKNTPLQLVDFSIGKFVYPKIYNDAIENAKKRELEVKKAQADAVIAQTKAQANIKIAKARYAVKMQEAKRIADFNKMVGNSVTNKLLQLRKLEVEQSIADNLKGNANVVYMPLPMMGNNKILLQVNKIKQH